MKGIVDLVGLHHLDVAGDVVLSTHVHHLLRLLHPARHASLHRSLPEYQRERRQLHRLLRRPHHHHRPVHLQQLQVMPQVVVRRHRVQ